MRTRIVLATLITVVAAASARAADLEQALAALASAAEQERSLSSGFKHALAGVIDALREAETIPSRAAAVTPVSAAPGGFWERLHPFADMRLRYEHSRHRPGLEDRNRARVRFRIGAEYDLHPEVVAGFRVRTGSPDDPNSPHQTLDGMFDSYDFNLDQVYFRYRPAWLEGAWGVAGKFSHPFVANPVYGDLPWDSDVQPEGIAVGYGRKLGERHSVELALGEYVLVEQDDGDEASAFAVQGRASTRWSDHWSSRVAVGWTRFSNLDPDGSTFALRDNQGNLLLDLDGDLVPDRYASEFSILNPWASVRYEGWRQPITLAGEFFLNTRAATSDDEGYAVGVSVGRLARARDWRLFYQFQRIEQEAIFSAFAQDDSLLSTNFSGHVLGLEYGLTDALSTRAWGLVSRRIDPEPGAFDDDQVRLRLDLNARF